MSSTSMAPSCATPETSRTGYFSGAGTSSHPSASKSVVTSAKSCADTKSVVSVPKSASRQEDENPFKLPPESQFFLLRNKERERQKAERERQKTLKVHEKMTHASKMSAQIAGLRREIQAEYEDEDPAPICSAVQESPTWKLTITKDSHVEKQSIKDFINKKREMFHLQYALSVKRGEMRKLEAAAASEEYKLEKAEQFLEEDAARFDEFLKENDRLSSEALNIADTETKLKMEKVSDIKRLQAKIVSLKSEIARCEEIIKEYIMYKQFLLRLSPNEWQEEYKKKWEARKQALKDKQEKEKLTSDAKVHFHSHKRFTRQMTLQHIQTQEPTQDNRFTSETRLKSPTAARVSVASPVVEEDNEDDWMSSDDGEEEPLLYFTDSRQLLDIFTELEQQNLSLIQNSQDTEETLDEIKQEFARLEQKMQKESQQLKDEILYLEEAIAMEEEKTNDLKIKSQVFSYGQYQPEDQDKMLESLNKKVAEVYHACIGENQAKHTTIQMLAVIEGQLMDLLDNLESIPTEKLELAEKAKAKERRQRFREVKMQQQKLQYEERARRALARSQSDIKKMTGRKLMNRSEPPATKQEDGKDKDKIDKEKEEIKFFFN